MLKIIYQQDAIRFSSTSSKVSSSTMNPQFILNLSNTLSKCNFTYHIILPCTLFLSLMHTHTYYFLFVNFFTTSFFCISFFLLLNWIRKMQNRRTTSITAAAAAAAAKESTTATNSMKTTVPSEPNYFWKERERERDSAKFARSYTFVFWPILCNILRLTKRETLLLVFIPCRLMDIYIFL